MQYKFVSVIDDKAQAEIDSYARLGWKVISIAAGSYGKIYIVFGRD